MNNPYIEKIENDEWIRRHERYPDWNENLNRITVTFINSRVRKWYVDIEKVSLKNELGQELKESNGQKDGVFSGRTNISPLALCFAVDKCVLQDGATFEIIMRPKGCRVYKKYVFVLQNNKWIEKVEE